MSRLSMLENKKASLEIDLAFVVAEIEELKHQDELLYEKIAKELHRLGCLNGTTCSRFILGSDPFHSMRIFKARAQDTVHNSGQSPEAVVAVLRNTPKY